ARIAFDSFPYQDFGFVLGKVSEISTVGSVEGQSPLNDSRSDPLFRIIITLERQTMTRDDITLPILPDMKAQARIIIERKPIFTWLWIAVRGLYSADGRG